MTKCESHDELVMVIGQVSVQLGEVHDDVKEIKNALHLDGNGGLIGWMHKVRGQINILKGITIALWAVVSGVVVAFVATHI